MIKTPLVLFAVTVTTIDLLLFSRQSYLLFPPTGMSYSRSYILWLHGLGDSGPANEPLKTLFTSPEFRSTRWSFPSAPSNPVTCNYGAVMPSWFDIHEIPVTATSPKDENSVLQAVKKIHSMIDKEIADGTSPNHVFVCGFSQGSRPSFIYFIFPVLRALLLSIQTCEHITFCASANICRRINVDECPPYTQKLWEGEHCLGDGFPLILLFLNKYLRMQRGHQFFGHTEWQIQLYSLKLVRQVPHCYPELA